MYNTYMPKCCIIFCTQCADLSHSTLGGQIRLHIYRYWLSKGNDAVCRSKLTVLRPCNAYFKRSMENKKRRDFWCSLNFTTYKKHVTSLLLQWNFWIWLVFLILGFLCSILRVCRVTSLLLFNLCICSSLK